MKRFLVGEDILNQTSNDTHDEDDEDDESSLDRYNKQHLNNKAEQIITSDATIHRLRKALIVSLY
jgi:hypothetical protein